MYQHRNKVYLSVSPRSLMIFFLNKEVVTVTSCFKFGNHFLWYMCIVHVYNKPTNTWSSLLQCLVQYQHTET